MAAELVGDAYEARKASVRRGAGSGVEVRVRAVRRRSWSAEDKLRIVRETLEAGARAKAVADRHGISTGLLFTWRKAMLATAMAGFAPVEVVPEVPKLEPPPVTTTTLSLTLKSSESLKESLLVGAEDMVMEEDENVQCRFGCERGRGMRKWEEENGAGVLTEARLQAAAVKPGKLPTGRVGKSRRAYDVTAADMIRAEQGSREDEEKAGSARVAGFTTATRLRLGLGVTADGELAKQARTIANEQG